MSTQQTPGHQPAPNGGAPAGHYPPAGYAQPKVPTSGMRVAAGVLALIASVVGLFSAALLLFMRHGGDSTPLNGWINFLLIVGSIGCLVTGIVIVAKQRKRGGATPWLVTSFAGLIVVVCLISILLRSSGLPGAWTLILPFALATLVLAVLVVVKDRRRR